MSDPQFPHQSVPDPDSPLRDPAEPTLPEPLVGEASDRNILGHKYDGIREYDNPMPGWWTWLFVATMAFAPVYVLGVHAFDWIDDYGDDLAEGQAELAAIREAYRASGVFDDDPRALAAYAADPAHAEAGAADYQAVCAACHGDQGQGLIGPNLADDYWVHGGTPADIYEILAVGVPAKGMPAWEGQFSEEERAALMAFVVSLQGTDPPNPKAPEGELVESF